MIFCPKMRSKGNKKGLSQKLVIKQMAQPFAMQFNQLRFQVLLTYAVRK